jgi:hypothetical protein
MNFITGSRTYVGVDFATSASSRGALRPRLCVEPEEGFFPIAHYGFVEILVVVFRDLTFEAMQKSLDWNFRKWCAYQPDSILRGESSSPGLIGAEWIACQRIAGIGKGTCA